MEGLPVDVAVLGRTETPQLQPGVRVCASGADGPADETRSSLGDRHLRFHEHRVSNRFTRTIFFIFPFPADGHSALIVVFVGSAERFI